ncbi:MAG: tRNA pseudouridine(38-40) synthase TruA [Desulfotalea sp.]
MFYYKIIIAYKGTAYCGWQAQSADTFHEINPSVQGVVQNALRKVANYQACSLSGASRTDAGVHAKGQLARISLEIEMKPEILHMALNAQLPDDIQLTHCEKCDKQFNPHTFPSSKEYHYYFSPYQISNPVFNDIADCVFCRSVDNHPHQERFNKMVASCRLFLGTHDFHNFCNKDKNISSTVRTVSYCDIHPANFGPLCEDIYYIKICGNGFLRYMVRYIAGALFEVFKGKVELDDIAHALSSQQPKKLSLKAKPKGLHLIAIN